jgi:polyvinyl alcohol dehydrogenase (cytochrome)
LDNSLVEGEGAPTTGTRLVKMGSVPVRLRLRLPRARPRLIVLAAIGSLLFAAVPEAGGSAAQSGGAPIGDWTVYHGDPLGTGVAAATGSLAHLRQRWRTPVLDGQLYGQPLVSGNLVVVATEADVVYGLSATTGRVRWSTRLGPPVPANTLPCGDIKPTVGVTSTPVIDPARDEIFAVADEERAGRPAHLLFGLDLGTGRIELRQDVDPRGADTAALLQRVALTLDAGRVVFGFGGNAGDCSTYHGWVMSVPEGGGTMHAYEFDPGAGESQGAVWLGGAAPIVDANGNIWVAAGNGSVDSTGARYDGSDAVVELSPELRRLQFFAPSDWASDNANDRDLGSSTPVLFSSGAVLQAGKSETAYLLSAAHLGGVGGQLAERTGICGGNVDGGTAVVGNTAYLPCFQGIEAMRVKLSPPSIAVLWQTSTGSGGPPIVAGGLVWTISQSGRLFALNPATGAAIESFDIGSVANHFPTPSVGAGLVLAPAADQVVAFGSK